ncbi:MAG: hypothetical protein P8J20_17585 [Novosphingobium sp.]|nr:hypothetical protein [Novosphingobium sp.]
MPGDEPFSNPKADVLTRWAGWCGMLGGPALAIAYIAHPPSAPPEIVASTFWIWVHVGFMASLLGGVFLLVALVGRYARSGGQYIGFAGFILAVISLIFVFGLDYAEVFIFPTLAVSHPEVVTQYGDGTSMPSVAFAFPATGIIFLVGFSLFSRALLKAGVIGRGAATLTIVGALVFTMGLSGFFPMVVVKTGATLFGGGLVWLGLSLWRPAH